MAKHWKTIDGYEDLDANRKAFVDWLVTPEDEREPKTQTKLAEELGVSYQTLSGWKYNDTFQEIVYKAKVKSIGTEDVNGVLDALITRAKKTNEDLDDANKATELFFKWLYGEDFNEGTKLNLTQNQAQSSEENKKIDVSNVPEDKLEDLINTSREVFIE